MFGAIDECKLEVLKLVLYQLNSYCIVLCINIDNRKISLPTLCIGVSPSLLKFCT